LVFNWLGFRKCSFSQHFPNNLKKVHSLKDIFSSRVERENLKIITFLSSDFFAFILTLKNI